MFILKSLIIIVGQFKNTFSKISFNIDRNDNVCIVKVYKWQIFLKIMIFFVKICNNEFYTKLLPIAYFLQ